MNSTALSYRLRWLHLPTGMLIMLLQRTPAPVLRALVQIESLLAERGAMILRSGVVAAAMGAYNSVAGATVFNVTPATPSSGAANSTFTVSGTAGTAMSVSISVSGAPGNPKSWSVKSTTPLPAGLSVTGGNPVNVVAPYKMTIAGTPTSAGTTSCTVTAWDGLNGTGGNSAKITVTFSITGGVSATAPSITTQPVSQSVTAGGSVTFTVAASGTPTPTYQWTKGGVDIAGATSATLSLSNVQAGDAGSYAAVATNSAGSATSSSATLTVTAVSVPPSITTQPVSQTVTAGGSVTFTSGASGSPAPTYQWTKGGANVAGATSASLTLNNVQAGDAGNYALVATNSAGTATSSAATLTVQAAAVAPSITTQPVSQTVTAGGSVTFTSGASGTPAPTYQWRKDGLNVAGATSATLSLSNVQAADAGSYTLAATNSAGTATSSAAVLTVQAAAVAPSISTQPVSQTVTVGGAASFTAAASGTPAPTYQWRKDGVNVAGATSGTLSLTNVQNSDAGSYTLVATNSAGSATSSAATLTVNAAPPPNSPPSFTTQPVSQTVTAGASVTFSAAAGGNPSPTYQWRKDGANLSGATGVSFTLASAQLSDAGSYTVVATNSAGTATSSAATLTVNAATVAPAFTTQPTSQSATAGGSVTFTVAASGNPAPTFQWSKDGVAISGATSATLALSNVQAANAGSYVAVATNSAGSATSSAATLTVNAAASAPTITSQPSSQTVTAGASVSFSAGSSGTPTPTCQWRKDGVAISGATGWTLTLSNVQAADAGSYTMVATNSAGTATSSAASLTVQSAAAAPAISTQPTSQAVTAGAAVTFSVVASGNPTPSYQWRKNGSNLAGATSASYAIAATVTADAGAYTVVVSNSAGSVTSSTATLTVAAASSGGPAITSLLTAQTVSTGHDISFTAQSLSGTYQWQVSTDSGASWSNLANNGTYAGATSRTLTVSGATAGLSGYLYRYSVTDSSGTSTSNSAALTVTAAFFPFPTGIVLVGSDTLYVTDSTANTVQKVTTAGVVTLLAGANGTAGTADGTAAAALFNQPGGLAATSAGVIYVTDTANATIRRIAADGTVTTLAGSTTARGNADATGTQATFSAPLGIALDAAGNLYVADSTNHTIRKVTSSGVVTTLAGAAGVAGYVDATGTAARFNYPAGIAVDAAGNVFVSDRSNNVIRRISTAGAVSTFAGVVGVSGSDDGTGSGALFNQPGGLVFDASGNLYVADTGNNTIRVITPAGAVTTLAGLPTVGGNQDGTGIGAMFNQPRALTIDASGNLYVTDTGNSSIRKVTPAGVVTTLTLQQGATTPASSGNTGGSTGGSSGSASSSGSTGSGAKETGAGALNGAFAAALIGLAFVRWAWRRRNTATVISTNL